MKKRKNNSNKPFLKLNAVKFGLACGILSSISFLVLILFGMYGYFPFINLIIADLYGNFGYNLTWQRVFLAPIYVFIQSFIGSGLFALVYNKFLK